MFTSTPGCRRSATTSNGGPDQTPSVDTSRLQPNDGSVVEGDEALEVLVEAATFGVRRELDGGHM